MLSSTMATTKKKTPKAAEPAGSAEQKTLAEVGREAAHAAQRKVLLAELKRQSWNLSATAEALGLSNGSNVIRSIRLLGLEEEYEAAKAAGKIPKGPRG